MPPLEHLLDFSHQHCVAICAVLVPANLTTTLLSLILAGRSAPRKWLHFSVSVATLLAVTLLLHVLSWFVIGVVMAPTYILLTLASVCLSFNTLSITHPHWLVQGWHWGQQQWQKRHQYLHSLDNLY